MKHLSETLMYDVIIVGGGPAGATAGKYLAQGGKKVLLLQKDLAFKKPCGGGLRMDAFDEFNIDKSIIDIIIETIILETKYQQIQCDISHMPLAIVNRICFDKCLRDSAQQAGVDIVEAHVIDIAVEPDFIRVFTEDKNHQSISYYGTHVIAADGVYSKIRQTLLDERVPNHLTYYSDIAKWTTKECSFYFDTSLSKQAYAWRFPYGNDTDIGTFGTKNYFDRLCYFLGLKQEIKKRGYPIPKWQSPCFYDNRVFYVGDAAGQVLPFTYEGIYYAMKSAKILSDVLLQNLPPSEYEIQWKKLYFEKFTTLKRLQSIFLSHNLMIFFMMRLLKKPLIQKKLLDLWMDKSALKLDLSFALRVVKRIF